VDVRAICHIHYGRSEGGKRFGISRGILLSQLPVAAWDSVADLKHNSMQSQMVQIIFETVLQEC
jgi:hypothetical protein